VPHLSRSEATVRFVKEGRVGPHPPSQPNHNPSGAPSFALTLREGWEERSRSGPPKPDLA